MYPTCTHCRPRAAFKMGVKSTQEITLVLVSVLIWSKIGLNSLIGK